jgi:hypothetical protein
MNRYVVESNLCEKSFKPPVQNLDVAPQESSTDNNEIYSCQNVCVNIIDSYDKKDGANWCFTCTNIWYIITLILICTLVPLSYKYVSYNQYGFIKNRFGTVDTSKVLTQGRHFYTLNYDLITFPATYQQVVFSDSTTTSLSVFTSDGYQIHLNLIFYYRIPKENLATIYNKYSTNYGAAVINQAKLTIKSLAGSSTSGFNIPLNQYIINRDSIEKQIAISLHNDLNTTVGVYVPIQYVRLQQITIPSNMIQQFLQTVVQEQDNLIQQNLQQVNQITAETGTLISAINATVNFTITNAYINSDMSVSNAKSEANNIVDTARGIGIANFIKYLNITDTDSISKLIKLFAIIDNVNPTIYYGLQSPLIVNKLSN